MNRRPSSESKSYDRAPQSSAGTTVVRCLPERKACERAVLSEYSSDVSYAILFLKLVRDGGGWGGVGVLTTGGEVKMMLSMRRINESSCQSKSSKVVITGKPAKKEQRGKQP